jgi:hypothetical protein
MNASHELKALFSVAVVAFLFSSCGGGSSSDSGYSEPASVSPSITSFADIENAPESETFTFGALNAQVDAYTRNNTFNYGVSNYLEKVKIGGGFSSYNFFRAYYSSYDLSVSSYTYRDVYQRVSTVSDGQAFILRASELDYNSLIVWSKGVIDFYGDTSIDQRAYNFGIPTARSDVPNSGSATYSGYMAGTYVVDPSGGRGSRSFLSGDTNINVNFSSKKLNGSFTNIQLESGYGFPDISVGGSYSGNKITGTVSSPGFDPTAPMSGDLKGRFYGPNGKEIGGVFSLARPDDAVLSGAFSASKN